jgi:hypothetical protein
MFDTFKPLNIIYNVIKDNADKLTVVMHPVCNIFDKEPYSVIFYDSLRFPICFQFPESAIHIWSLKTEVKAV